MPGAAPLLAVCLVFATSGLVAQGYTLVLDGKRVVPTESTPVWQSDGRIVSLDGDRRRVRPGDLAWVGGALLRLDEPGTYDFAGRIDREGRVSLRRGGTERIVAVAGDRLLACDPVTRRQLLGVVVRRWNDDVGRALAELDPTAPIVLSSEAAVGESHALPPLPPTTRHLVLLHDTAHGFGDCSAARALTELRSLDLGGNHSRFSSVDLALFAGATELRWLRIAGPRIVNAEAVGRFRALRWFDGEDVALASFAPLLKPAQPMS